VSRDAACLPVSNGTHGPSLPETTSSLTHLFFLQGLCPNKAKLFLTQRLTSVGHPRGPGWRSPSPPLPCAHLSFVANLWPE
jgi:hypothetical protein